MKTLLIRLSAFTLLACGEAPLVPDAHAGEQQPAVHSELQTDADGVLTISNYVTAIHENFDESYSRAEIANWSEARAHFSPDDAVLVEPMKLIGKMTGLMRLEARFRRAEAQTPEPLAVGDVFRARVSVVTGPEEGVLFLQLDTPIHVRLSPSSAVTDAVDLLNLGKGWECIALAPGDTFVLSLAVVSIESQWSPPDWTPDGPFPTLQASVVVDPVRQ